MNFGRGFGFAGIFGYTKEEYLATIIDLETDLELVHPEDRDRYRAYNDDRDLDLKDWEIEYRIITRDGNIRHVNERYRSVFDASGQPTQ